MTFLIHDGPPDGALPRLNDTCAAFSKLRSAIEGADAAVFFLAAEGQLILRIPIVAGTPRKAQMISPLHEVLTIHGEEGQVMLESDVASISRFLTGQEPSALFAWNGRVHGRLPELSVIAGTFESRLWRRAVEEARLTPEDIRTLLTWTK